MKANLNLAGDRLRQFAPVALLAVFVTALAVAIALVHTWKTKATQDYLAAEADVERVKNDVIEKYVWGEFDKEKTAAVMKDLDRRHGEAEEKHQEAMDAAYSRQVYITYGGAGMFVILCAVTFFLARRSATEPPA